MAYFYKSGYARYFNSKLSDCNVTSTRERIIFNKLFYNKHIHVAKGFIGEAMRMAFLVPYTIIKSYTAKGFFSFFFLHFSLRIRNSYRKCKENNVPSFE